MQKVKVRIAVAVDPSGDWNSAGWESGSDDDKMGIACETVAPGEARYWIEAELDVPEAVVVEATVTPNAPGNKPPTTGDRLTNDACGRSC